MGNWARVTEITHTTIKLRSLDGEAPRQIEFRTIELALDAVSRCAPVSGADRRGLYFRLNQLTPLAPRAPSSLGSERGQAPLGYSLA